MTIKKTVSARTLAVMATRTKQWLTQQATLEAETTAQDEFGYPTHAWDVVANGVACRLIAVPTNRTGEMSRIGDQETMSETYRLICDPDAPLASDQRVTIDGTTYDVVSIITDLTDKLYTEALVTRAVRT